MPPVDLGIDGFPAPIDRSHDLYGSTRGGSLVTESGLTPQIPGQAPNMASHSASVRGRNT